MEPLTLTKLAANAYRTLGISSTASQAQVESAARRLRVWPDPARIPPTPWDVPWLGPVERTRSDIDRALAALSEPSSRVEERLLWYGRTPPPPVVEQVPAAVGRLDASAGPADRHDAALAALHLASADGADADEWRGVVERFARLSAACDFTEAVQAAEAEGAFEKRASPAEVDAAIAELPEALTGALMLQAKAALDSGDNAAAGALVALTHGSTAQGAAPSLAAAHLLDTLEDRLAAQCREVETQLRNGLRTNRDQPDAFYVKNLALTRGAAASYQQTVAGWLDQLRAMAGDDTDRVARASSQAAQLMVAIALGWEWAGRCVNAEQTLRVARDLAGGTAFETVIDRELARVLPLVEDERSGRTAARIRKNRRRIVAVSRQAQPAKSGFPRTLIFWVVLGAVRLISTLSSRTSEPLPTYEPPRLDFPEWPKDANPTYNPPNSPSPGFGEWPRQHAPNLPAYQPHSPGYTPNIPAPPGGGFGPPGR